MTTTESEQDKARHERVPYRGEQLYRVPEDFVQLGALDIDGADERLWVPQALNVTFRPLLSRSARGTSSTSCGCGPAASCRATGTAVLSTP